LGWTGQDSDTFVVVVRGAIFLHLAVLLSFLSIMILGALVDHHGIVALRCTHSGSRGTSALSEVVEDLLAVAAVWQLLAYGVTLWLAPVVSVGVAIGALSEVVFIGLIGAAVVLVELH